MKRGLVILVLLITLNGCRNQSPRPLTEKLHFALTAAQRKALLTFQHLNPAQYPRSTQPDGSWSTTSSRGWTSGFFPGTLWYLYEYTQDTTFKNMAAVWTAGLEQEKNNLRTHDLGFMIYCSFGNGYRLTGDATYKDIILKTSKTLITRFNPTVGCIKSWDFMGPGTYPVIIDNMMNLEMLFWAAETSGDSRFSDIAVKHADTTINNHFRPDASTWHVVMYDENNGGVIEKITHQGYRDDSAWARGQAWGLYGYTLMFRETRNTTYLNQAVRIADYFIQRLPEDHIPYWDFDAPGIPDEPRDASAAAIAASALLELSPMLSDEARANRYWTAAESMLQSLTSPDYLDDSGTFMALLKHSTGHKPENKEVDVGICYADYYFVEAALRYLNHIKSE